MMGYPTSTKLSLGCGAGAFCLLALAGPVVGQTPQSFTRGLVSCWPARGNANDLVDGNNGTPEGGVAYGPGKPGQAFVFDGSTGRFAYQIRTAFGSTPINSLSQPG